MSLLPLAVIMTTLGYRAYNACLPQNYLCKIKISVFVLNLMIF